MTDRERRIVEAVKIYTKGVCDNDDAILYVIQHGEYTDGIRLCNALIPEGAVVLTKEEYERLKALPEKVHDEMEERMKEEIAIEKRMGEDKLERFENNMKNVLEIEKENIRKETAKQILKRVKKRYRDCDESARDFLKFNDELSMYLHKGGASQLYSLGEYIKKEFGVEGEE